MVAVTLIKYDVSKNWMLVEQNEVQGWKDGLIEERLSTPARFLIVSRRGALEDYNLYVGSKYLVSLRVGSGVDDNNRIRPQFWLLKIVDCFDVLDEDLVQTNESYDPE